MATNVAQFQTAIGSCTIAWNDKGICGLQLLEQAHDARSRRLTRHHPGTEEATPTADVRRVIERVQQLLDGEPDDLLDVEVDLARLPEFSRRVLEATREVRPGETTTYGEIARRLGSPQRAREVGQALGHNPVPLIIPCHRVLGAGGKLVGFSAPGGVTTKLRLLAIEGAAHEGQPALF